MWSKNFAKSGKKSYCTNKILIFYASFLLFLLLLYVSKIPAYVFFAFFFAVIPWKINLTFHPSFWRPSEVCSFFRFIMSGNFIQFIVVCYCYMVVPFSLFFPHQFTYLFESGEPNQSLVSHSQRVYFSCS